MPDRLWQPKLGDEVWLNRPDGGRMGKVVGFVSEGRRQGQPIIEALDDEPGFLRSPGIKKGDQRVCHPMFLLPFKMGGEEYKRALAEGRVSA